MKNRPFFKTKRDWVKYRWEFMRRDPDFIRAHDNLISVRESFKKGKISEEELNKTSQEFWREFDLFPPGIFIDRHKSFEELEQIFGEKSLLPVFLGQNMNMDHLPTVTVPMQYGGKKVPAGHLLLKINLNNVNSIDALKKEVALYLDLEWRMFLSKHPDREKTTKLRSEFDKIIELGDLKRDNPRWGYQRLGNKCLAEDLNPESRKQRAENHLARYRELTAGGWREFRFP